MKVCAGIIGMGVGKKHFEAIEGYKKSYVKTICEKNTTLIRTLKNKFPNKIITKNENDIFNDKEINLVSIASYDENHYSQVCKSLSADKHVIVEKPMCLKMSEMRDIENLLRKKKNLNILSNLVLRYNSKFNNIKNYINLKKDKIYYIEADYLWGRPHKLYGWRSKTKNYSIILGATIHMIDLVMQILKNKPTHVYSTGNNIATKGSKFKGKSFELITLTFPKNLIVKITGNGPCRHDHYHELKIFSKKYSIIHSFSSSHIFNGKKRFKIRGNYPDKKNRKNLIREFILSLIHDKKQNKIDKQNLFNLMKICFSAIKSSKLNRKIKIKY